jgi:hypothetical protein
MKSQARPFEIPTSLFIESFKRHKLLKNKVQWLDLAPHLWPMLVGVPSTRTINIHYEIIIKYFKPHLISFSPNYFWFMVSGE